VKLSTGDKIRVALTPLHLIVGCRLLYRFVKDTRLLGVALLGASFVTYGVYRLLLVGRAVLGARRGRT
jgi:hypothetical protein